MNMQPLKETAHQETNSEGSSTVTQDGFTFSPPVSSDGIRVHRLVASCPPLDENSIYCNILQCDHFSATSVKVEKDGELVAFISGYIPPGEPNVLFIWQVAVSSVARGKGLGKRMMDHLIKRPSCEKVRFLHTTVTPDNDASGGMFASFARHVGAPVSKEVLYDSEGHFDGKHESEVRFVIGPFHSLT